MKQPRHNIRILLEELNKSIEKLNVEYKYIFEYRYNKKYHSMYISRSVVVYHLKSKINTQYFKNDNEALQYLANEYATHNAENNCKV